MIGLWLSALSSLSLFAIGLIWYFELELVENDIAALEQSRPAIGITPSPVPSDDALDNTNENKTNAETVTTAPNKFTELRSVINNSRSSIEAQKNTDTNSAQIAIIIDDLGYQWDNGLRSIQLEGDYTLSILPFSPYSTKLAKWADEYGKEVMLHAPMEPISHQAWGGGLTNNMSQKELISTLDQMLDDIPNAKGINNHMGSALTQNSQMMTWLMKEIFNKDLYFIDSLTTPLSKAYLVAQQQSVTSQKRDIFLDNIREHDAIDNQFNKLLKLARKTGTAIAICHPYPETLAYLEKAKTKILDGKVRLVSIAHLLSTREKRLQYSPEKNHLAQAQSLQAAHPKTSNPLTQK